VDVRIGVTNNPKELVVELAEDADRAALKKQIEAALVDEDSVLWLTDKKGREIAVPAERIAYVELSSAVAERPIGFGG
jgi:hypothetical protein